MRVGSTGHLSVRSWVRGDRCAGEAGRDRSGVTVVAQRRVRGAQRLHGSGAYHTGRPQPTEQRNHVNESSKSRQLFTAEEREFVRGRVLDIGAGADPVTPGAVAFDQAQGDANRITAFAPGSFDCVYSSHCLEHMHEPVATLKNWWSLVRPGGILFVIVPDEDLYEQGRFPSRFNDDHKSTFTLSKKRSWSSRSHNVLEMAQALPQSQLVSLRLNDIGYDRRRAAHNGDKPGVLLLRVLRAYRSLRKRGLANSHWMDLWVAHAEGVDQTRGEAVAQIELVVRKLA